MGSKFMVFRRAILLALPSLLIACGGPQPIATAPTIERAALETLPVPADAFAIQPFDLLTIAVFGQEDLSGEVEVGADGAINFPLVGLVQAGGLEPSALAARLEMLLGQGYLRAPDVTVRPDRRFARQLFVGGQVSRPGSFPYQTDLTLSQSIILAGGTAEFADLEEVLIQREIGGQKYIGVYNIKSIQRGNYADPAVYPGDTVLVGDTPGFRRLTRILGLLPLITQPLILIDRI